MKAYIIENDLRNKVNRYSLYVFGKTIFNDRCAIELPHDYLNISTSGTNIEKFIKKLPTPEDLKSYYHQNKDRILKKFLKTYIEFQETNFKIVQKYSISDFLPLAEAKCDKCGYFIIVLDKDNYYLDNKECPKCYNKSYFKIEKKRDYGK